MRLLSFHLLPFSILLSFLQVSAIPLQEMNDTVDSASIYYESMKENAYSNPEIAKVYGRQALKHAPLSKEKAYHVAKANNGLGIIYKNQGQYDSAGYHFEQASKVYLETNNLQGYALTLNNIGIMLNDLGKYSEATNHILNAIRIGDSLHLPSILSVSTNNMGIIQYAQANYEKALESFRQAQKYYQEEKNLRGEVGTRMNIATILFSHLHELEPSKAEFKQAALQKKALSDLRGVSFCYTELGNIFKTQRIYDSAIYFMKMSIDIKIGLNDKKGLSNCYSSLANIYLESNQPNLAVKYGILGYDLAKEISSGDEMISSGESLANAYVGNQNFKEASTLWQKTYQLRDSLLGVKNLEMINDLQTKYETEKKERTIALQHVEITEQQLQLQRNFLLIGTLTFVVVLLLIIILLFRNRAKQKHKLLIKENELKLKEAEIAFTISSQERERSRYARDLHDGFGQLISILNMNLKGLEAEGSREKRETIFNSASEVLEEMYNELRTICFNLMPQVLIKNGVDLAIREFASRINQAGKQEVEVDIFGMEERLNEVQEISIYRITQEWVNNILKHSDADKITIQLTKDEEEVTLLIEDNGSGFEKEKLSKGSGNGWKNLHSRANLINAKIELDVEEGRKGNTFILNVPHSYLAIEIPS